MFHMNIAAALLVLLAWLSEHAEALMNASALLGGPRAFSRTARLLDDLRREPALNTRVRRELQALRDLLALEHVDDPERDESAWFALIDPADPVVYDLCMLRDGLEALLGDLPEPNASPKPFRPRAA